MCRRGSGPAARAARLGAAPLAAALLAVAAAAAPAAGAQPAPGTTELRLLSLEAARLGPLTAAEYDAGHTTPVAVEFAVSACAAALSSPMPGRCALQIHGIIPFEGLTLPDVQWAPGPGGPWTALGPLPATVLTLPTGQALPLGRLYLRARVSYAEVPARPADYLSVVRLRLVQ